MSEKQPWQDDGSRAGKDRKNTIGIVGEIAAPVELIVNASDWKRKVYETKLTRERPSGKEDIYILQFDGYAAGSEETVNKIAEGTKVMVGGEIRTENVCDPQPEENSVKVFIYAEVIAINDPPAEEQNEVRICGKICKPPRFRSTCRRTANGKKLSVASITVAVNTPSSTSYIPCVCYGWNALRANLLKVGDYVEIYGHFRSRDYAEGSGTTAEGDFSHTEGTGTTASGDCSHAEGYCTKALVYQHVQGHYNDTTKATAGVGRGTGDSTAFCIGNGTETTASNAVRVDFNGKIWCKQAYSSTGADYAELFEWLDGNPDNEDRRGYFVTMDGEKIRKAEPGEWILGIVSANPCILGNTDMEWQGQFLRDEFNDFIIETGEETVIETVYEKDADGNIILDGDGNPISHEVEKKIPYQFYKVNPDYDPNEEYIFRLDRKEWDAVGMIGVLAVRDDGTCKVNGFCTCAAGGIATESETGYRVISRVNEHIVKIVLIK